MRWVALLGAPLGVLLTVWMGSATGFVLGWPPLQGLIVGVVISVSSTIVLARLLMDRGELHSRHGRVLIGISLVEDLAAVVLMVMTPQLGSLEDPKPILGLAVALGKSAAILVPFWYLSSKVFPPLMTRAAQTRSSELFLLFALAVGLGTSAATQAMGLSVALGAFLAGLIISESDYAHEALARLLSLRDAFVTLFSVTIGVLIDVRRILDNLPLLVAIVALILGGKFVLRTGSCGRSASRSPPRYLSAWGWRRSASSRSFSSTWRGPPDISVRTSTRRRSPPRSSPSCSTPLSSARPPPGWARSASPIGGSGKSWRPSGSTSAVM